MSDVLHDWHSCAQNADEGRCWWHPMMLLIGHWQTMMNPHPYFSVDLSTGAISLLARSKAYPLWTILDQLLGDDWWPRDEGKTFLPLYSYIHITEGIIQCLTFRNNPPSFKIYFIVTIRLVLARQWNLWPLLNHHWRRQVISQHSNLVNTFCLDYSSQSLCVGNKGINLYWREEKSYLSISLRKLFALSFKVYIICQIIS